MNPALNLEPATPLQFERASGNDESILDSSIATFIQPKPQLRRSLRIVIVNALKSQTKATAEIKQPEPKKPAVTIYKKKFDNAKRIKKSSARKKSTKPRRPNNDLNTAINTVQEIEVSEPSNIISCLECESNTKLQFNENYKHLADIAHAAKTTQEIFTRIQSEISNSGEVNQAKLEALLMLGNMSCVTTILDIWHERAQYVYDTRRFE